MKPVRLEPTAPQSRVKHSTNEPLRSPSLSESAVKPALSGHSKIVKPKVLMAKCSIMKVESIAECLEQKFRPVFSNNWS